MTASAAPATSSPTRISFNSPPRVLTHHMPAQTKVRTTIVTTLTITKAAGVPRKATGPAPAAGIQQPAPRSHTCNNHADRRQQPAPNTCSKGRNDKCRRSASTRSHQSAQAAPRGAPCCHLDAAPHPTDKRHGPYPTSVLYDRS